jgi:hypothetical protein
MNTLFPNRADHSPTKKFGFAPFLGQASTEGHDPRSSMRAIAPGQSPCLPLNTKIASRSYFRNFTVLLSDAQ